MEEVQKEGLVHCQKVHCLEGVAVVHQLEGAAVGQAQEEVVVELHQEIKQVEVGPLLWGHPELELGLEGAVMIQVL